MFFFGFMFGLFTAVVLLFFQWDVVAQLFGKD